MVIHSPNIPQLVALSFNRHGTISSANAALGVLLKKQARDLTGEDALTLVYSAVGDEASPLTLELILEHARGGTSLEQVFQIDGKPLLIRWTFLLLTKPADSEEEILAVGIVADNGLLAATHPPAVLHQNLFNRMGEAFGLAELLEEPQDSRPDFRFVDVNPAFEQLLDLGAPVAGKRLLELMPDLPLNVTQCLRRVTNTGNPEHLEYYSDRLRKWLHIFVYAPAPGFCAALISDITAQIVASEALAFVCSLSAAFAQLTEPEVIVQKAASLAVPFLGDCCIIDLLLTEATIERAAIVHQDLAKERLLRSAAEKSKFRMRRPSVLKEVLQNGVAQAFPALTPQVLSILEPPRCRAGIAANLAFTSCISVPLAVGRRVLGAMTLFRCGRGLASDEQELTLAADVAARTAAALESARLYAEARDSERRKDNFLAMLGHELRNPLAAVSSGVNILRRSSISADRREWVYETLERQTKQLCRLLDDLLDLSRISRGKIKLREDMVNITEAVDRAVQATVETIREKQHSFAVQVTEPRLTVKGDAARMEQILVHLISNAAKFTPQGGRIQLTVSRRGANAVITVKDNGFGIEPEIQGKIFELFGHADGTTAGAQRGLGLGLSLVRTLTELHGGTIGVKSAGPGKGSEFVIKLPLAQSAATVDPLPVPPPAASEVNLRILLVEDNPDAARMMAALLEAHGHYVRVAHDGPAALAAAEEDNPEAILLDIGLPGMDGYEVGRRLRHDLGLNDALIVAATGFGQERDSERAREAGFDHHLVKPVEYESLALLFSGWRKAPRTKQNAAASSMHGAA